MFVRANFVDIYFQGMPDGRMRSGTELAREIQLTDWSTAGNLSNRSSGVQIPRDICTRLKRYLYSAKCSWIIKHVTRKLSAFLTTWDLIRLMSACVRSAIRITSDTPKILFPCRLHKERLRYLLTLIIVLYLSFALLNEN